jgi:hypothetical protein
MWYKCDVLWLSRQKNKKSIIIVPYIMHPLKECSIAMQQ